MIGCPRDPGPELLKKKSSIEGRLGPKRDPAFFVFWLSENLERWPTGKAPGCKPGVHCT